MSKDFEHATSVAARTSLLVNADIILLGFS